MADRKRKEFTEKQLTYIVWAAQPDGVREPNSREEWAALFGVEKSTAWRWSKDPRVMDAVRYVVLQNAGSPGRVKELLDHVFKRAMKDDQYSLKAAELWIKSVGITGQFDRASSVLDAVEAEESFSDFSTEELKRLREEQIAQTVENIGVERAKVLLAAKGVPIPSREVNDE